MQKLSGVQAEKQLFGDNIQEKVEEQQSVPAPSPVEELQMLEKQMREIQQKMIYIQNHARRDAMSKIRAIAFSAKLTREDLQTIADEAPEDGSPMGSIGTAAKSKKHPSAGSKVEPKYRDPATGNTWTGRGKPPKWMEEEGSREKYLIAH